MHAAANSDALASPPVRASNPVPPATGEDAASRAVTTAARVAARPGVW
jgi:hypothetical protein